MAFYIGVFRERVERCLPTLDAAAGNTTICRGQNLAPQIRVEGRPALGEEHRLRLFQKKVLGGVIGWKREEKRRG